MMAGVHIFAWQLTMGAELADYWGQLAFQGLSEAHLTSLLASSLSILSQTPFPDLKKEELGSGLSFACCFS